MEQTERRRGGEERKKNGRKTGLGEETQREEGITREDFPNNPPD